MSTPGEELAHMSAEQSDSKKNEVFRLPWEEEPAASGAKTSTAKIAASMSTEEPVAVASAAVKAPSAYAASQSASSSETPFKVKKK